MSIEISTHDSEQGYGHTPFSSNSIFSGLKVLLTALHFFMVYAYIIYRQRDRYLFIWLHRKKSLAMGA